jgi:HK97 family phage major capsid protein
MNASQPAQPLETKSMSADYLDLKDAFGDFMSTFEAFKESNDQKLAEMDRRLGADVLTTEKVDRISRALDEQKRAIDNLSLKRARPVLGQISDREQATLPSEHKQAFEAYTRRLCSIILRRT